MEVIISEHSRNKRFALLKSLLPYESFRGIITYNNLIHLNYDQIKTMIKYNPQVFIFTLGASVDDFDFTQNTDEEIEILRNKKFIYIFDSKKEIRRAFHVDKTENAFTFNYEKTRITMSSITPTIFSYNFNALDLNFITLIYFYNDGKVKEIRDVNGSDFIYYADIGFVTFRSDGEVIEDDSKGLAHPDDDISYTVDLPNGNEGIMFLNFHPDGTLKTYQLVINSKRQGLYYQSDEYGNITFTSYRNDQLHGYYYDSLTDKQGFYQNGFKVGFWKEGGQIINYDKNRIFFPFPIFLL